jgi:hypothetical protein
MLKSKKLGVKNMTNRALFNISVAILVLLSPLSTRQFSLKAQSSLPPVSPDLDTSSPAKNQGSIGVSGR